MISPHTTEKIAKFALWATAPISILILLVIVFYIIFNGAHVIDLQFLSDSPGTTLGEGGIFSAIVGTIWVVIVCMLVAVPLGVGAAIYLTEYARESIVTKTINFFIDCLAGIPSVVIGLFGLSFLVVYLGFGYSILSGGLSLAFMILPWTVRASEEAVKAVPKSYREASLALGATKWQTIRNVVLKNAIPGITTGSILGLGKAMGEAAVILLVMGGTISGFLPTSIFDNALTLPVYLYTLATQGNSPMAFEKAYGTALVLLAMFFMMSLFAMFIRNRYARRQ